MSNAMGSSRTTYISDRSFDEERAFYGRAHAQLERVRFAGPADGESALKECQDIAVSDTTFELRYPLWHVKGLTIEDALLTDTCRAALWYTGDVRIERSRLLGIKALRECHDVRIEGSEVRSAEFGWMCHGVMVRECTLEGEYLGWYSDGLTLVHDTLDGCGAQIVVRGLDAACVSDVRRVAWGVREAARMRCCCLAGA